METEGRFNPPTLTHYVYTENEIDEALNTLGLIDDYFRVFSFEKAYVTKVEEYNLLSYPQHTVDGVTYRCYKMNDPESETARGFSLTSHYDSTNSTETFVYDFLGINLWEAQGGIIIPNKTGQQLQLYSYAAEAIPLLTKGALKRYLEVTML